MTPSTNLRVLIVGASIAGPMTAYWLARAGCTITIIERYPSLRAGGQSIDIRSVGVTVMRKIPGMEDLVKAKRPPIDSFRWVDGKGNAYAEMKPSGDSQAQTLISEFEIYRGDLSGIICDYLRAYEKDGKVKFIFDEQLASISQPGNGDDAPDGPVTVEFQNGTPTAEFDLVVAADGSTSRTRALGFNCGVRDHIVPSNMWAAYFTAPQDLLSPGDPGAAHNSPPGRFFGIGPSPADEGGTKGIMITALPTTDDAATLPFRTAQKQGEDALKKHVADLYHDAGWRAPEIVQGLLDSKDFYASEIVQVKVPSLSKGRFVLVGDAGHASGFGTGTSLAMCGAYVLAGEILSHPDSVREGLAAYEQRMAPIIKDMQNIPPGIRSFLAPQTHWGLAVRNVFLRIVCFGMRFGKYFSWVMRFFGSAFEGDKFGLPEYKWVA